MSSLPASTFRNNQMFQWVDGLPQPSNNADAFQKEQVQQLIQSALALPYDNRVWNSKTQQWEMEDERYENATRGEVMIDKLVKNAASTGDKKEVGEILDRILGKPKQAVESVSMQLSYSEWLERTAEMEKDDIIIDVTPEPLTPSEVSYFDDDPEDWLNGV